MAEPPLANLATDSSEQFGDRCYGGGEIEESMKCCATNWGNWTQPSPSPNLR